MDGYKQEENFGGKNMNKMLKAMAMLLVIAAVVFAAGCSSPKPAAENNTTPAPVENKTIPAETTNVTPATTAETTAPVIIPAATNETANVTENVSAPAATNVTHVSNTLRKQQLAKERAQGVIAENATNATQ